MSLQDDFADCRNGLVRLKEVDGLFFTIPYSMFTSNQISPQEKFIWSILDSIGTGKKHSKREWIAEEQISFISHALDLKPSEVEEIFKRLYKAKWIDAKPTKDNITWEVIRWI